MRKRYSSHYLKRAIIGTAVAMAISTVYAPSALADSYTVSAAQTSTYALDGADTLIVTNTGSITVETTDTATSATGVDVTGDLTGSISNSGAISATANATGALGYASAYGVYIGGDLAGSLTNSGDISATANATGATSGSASAYGVYIDGLLSGTLTNNGTINATAINTKDNATAEGIYVDSDVTGAIINNGTINATATATGTANASDAYAYGIDTGDLGAYASITNSGTINVTATTAAGASDNSAEATGIYTGSLGVGASINNSGTITVIATADTDSASAWGIVTGDLGVNASIINSGIITATANAATWASATGIDAGNLDVNASITNSGVITATAISTRSEASATGIDAGSLGVNASITNSGTITAQATAYSWAGAYGIYTGDLGVNASIINSGIITASAITTSSECASAYGIYTGDLGVNASIINSGIITATANAATWASATGIDAGNLDVNASITNSGVITATAISTSSEASAIGIYAGSLGVNASITNSGTITAQATATSWAGATGIDAGNLDDGASITNSGTITATAISTATDSYASAYGITTGSLGDGASINNSGNIIAAASGITYASAYGIEVYDMTAGASINNSGTITALVASDSDSGSAYGIYVSGTMDADATITNSGTITAAGPMNDLAYSIYIGSGSGNVINSGMLTGSIDLGGTVSLTNTGTLDIPADGGYGYVGGDYDQTDGGMLKIGVQDATDYGYLQVDGTATLEDDANIRVNLMPDNELVNGDTLDDVIDASLGTLDSGPDYNVTDNSLPWRFAAVADGDTIDLTVTRTGMTTYVAAVKSDDLNSAKGVAGILDNFYEQGAPNADFDELLYTLGSLNRASEVADGVSKLLPLMSGGLPQAALNALHSSNRIIQARQDETSGLSSGDPAQAAKAVWLKPFGSWADQDDRDGAIGYDADTAGLVIGVDTLAFTNFRLGAAFIYANSDVDSNSSVAPQNADIDTYEIAFYGSYSIDDRTDLNFQADIGQGSYDGKRTIHIGPSNSIAKSDYDSTNYHLGVGVGREIKINDKTSLIPSMRVDYTAINEDGYTEKGSGPFNLKVDSNDTEELVFALEGKINHSLTPALTLSGNLGLGYDAISDEASITSSFVDGGGNFVTDGIDPSPFMLRAGLGVELTPWTNGLAIVARYEVEAREDFTNQTVSMKLRKSF